MGFEGTIGERREKLRINPEKKSRFGAWVDKKIGQKESGDSREHRIPGAPIGPTFTHLEERIEGHWRTFQSEDEMKTKLLPSRLDRLVMV